MLEISGKPAAHHIGGSLQDVSNKGDRLSAGSPEKLNEKLESSPSTPSLSKSDSNLRRSPHSVDRPPPSSISPIENKNFIEAAPNQPRDTHKAAHKSSTSIPFRNSKISVAVDISTSTRGLILSQEALAISTICRLLSKKARKNGHLLPWSKEAHPILRLKDSAELKVNYGTDPSALCSNSAHVTALKKSELWILMTDGQIEEETINKFADGIARNGLHGIICVIMLFGNLPRKPCLLNTSVGISLFAVASNCLFLFHDVDSGRTYVLQHKGCFTTSFEGIWSVNPSLDTSATWNSLSLTSHKQLAMLRIPKPVTLGKDEIALIGGKTIKIQDLYQGRLNPQTVSEIFENDDNIKTVLLTAATRGKSAEVEAWLAEQRMTALDCYTAPRLDINQKAYFCTEMLIKLMKNEESQSNLIDLQRRLRDAHATNWIRLRASIECQLVETNTRNEYVTACIDRSISTRVNSLSSPANLSLFSSAHRVNMKPSQQFYQYNQFATTVPYLFTPNYRRTTGYSSETKLSGYCSLCGDLTSLPALLLKKPDPNLRTQALPAPGSQTRLAFPLAMGNFPETDIISSFVCCDPCSYFITQAGEAPPDEKIVGFILLHNFNENQHLWISALDKALEQRFAKEDLALLFLAILYMTLLDIDTEIKQQNLTIRGALHWAIDQLQQSVQAPMSLSQCLAAPGEGVTYSKFFNVLKQSFLGVSMPQPPILRYPIEGFSILVRAAKNMKILEQKAIDNVVFERLLFHLTEQFIALHKAGSHTNPTLSDEISGSNLITDFVPMITKFRTQNEEEDQRITTTPVTVASLYGGPLLSEEDFAIFQTMVPSILTTEDPGAEIIIDKFIRIMIEVTKEIVDPVRSFDYIRRSLGS